MPSGLHYPNPRTKHDERGSFEDEGCTPMSAFQCQVVLAKCQGSFAIRIWDIQDYAKRFPWRWSLFSDVRMSVPNGPRKDEAYQNLDMRDFRYGLSSVRSRHCSFYAQSTGQLGVFTVEKNELASLTWIVATCLLSEFETTWRSVTGTSVPDGSCKVDKWASFSEPRYERLCYGLSSVCSRQFSSYAQITGQLEVITVATNELSSLTWIVAIRLRSKIEISWRLVTVTCGDKNRKARQWPCGQNSRQLWQRVAFHTKRGYQTFTWTLEDLHGDYQITVKPRDKVQSSVVLITREQPRISFEVKTLMNARFSSRERERMVYFARASQCQLWCQDPDRSEVVVVVSKSGFLECLKFLLRASKLVTALISGSRSTRSVRRLSESRSLDRLNITDWASPRWRSELQSLGQKILALVLFIGQVIHYLISSICTCERIIG